NNAELIKNQLNGILITLPNIEKFYSKNEMPNEHSLDFLKSMRKCRKHVTEKLVESLRLLIENDKLRIKMSIEAKKTIENGEFSAHRRNLLLKKIFDEST
ncbi:MAG: glycosyltransferase family 1 protein, partial [Patescibacteria group bacterium]|nr:glycosyltransferase family 1 protein [Patescibacteria group bacterium]